MRRRIVAPSGAHTGGLLLTAQADAATLHRVWKLAQVMVELYSGIVSAMHRLGMSETLPLFHEGSLSRKSRVAMFEIKTILLFLVTAVAEIVGCYLPHLWLAQGKSAWLLVPAGLSLALFAWLLSLHPSAAGRVYAAYGALTSSWLFSGSGRSMA